MIDVGGSEEKHLNGCNCQDVLFCQSCFLLRLNLIFLSGVLHFIFSSTDGLHSLSFVGTKKSVPFVLTVRYTSSVHLLPPFSLLGLIPFFLAIHELCCAIG